MFKVKICGITTTADGKMVATAGADAIGLNFYAPSPRSVDLETAQKIVQAIPKDIATVGVFVDSTSEEICQIFDRLDLDYVQLHGDQSVEFAVQLGNRPLIRAFRCQDYDLKPVRQYWQECQDRQCPLKAILLDAYQADLYGGTGKTVNWELASQEISSLAGIDVALSGGLEPLNVKKAITIVRPTAVDTASGVESSPGVKDPELVRSFVTAARQAMAEIGH